MFKFLFHLRLIIFRFWVMNSIIYFFPKSFLSKLFRLILVLFEIVRLKLRNIILFFINIYGVNFRDVGLQFNFYFNALKISITNITNLNIFNRLLKSYFVIYWKIIQLRAIKTYIRIIWTTYKIFIFIQNTIFIGLAIYF